MFSAEVECFPNTFLCSGMFFLEVEGFSSPWQLRVLFCQTFGTDATIIQIGRLNGKALRCRGGGREQVIGRLDVEDSSTLMA